MSWQPSIFPFPLTSNVHSNTLNSALFGSYAFDKFGNKFQMVVAKGSSVATFRGGYVGWHTSSNVLTGYTVSPDVSATDSNQAPAGICMASIAATSVQAGNRVFWVLKAGNPRQAGLNAIVTDGKAGAGDYLVESASDGRFTGLNPTSITGATNAAAGLRNALAKNKIWTPSADGTTSLITSTRIGAVRVACP